MVEPIEFYHWPSPNGAKVGIALEEMGLPYVIKPVNFYRGEQFYPDFLRISPNNRVPAIVDPSGPEGAPISVFESGAILQYLARKTGRFYGDGERERVEIEQWLMWQMAGLGPTAGQASHWDRYACKLVEDPLKLDYGRTRYNKELDRLLGVFDRRIQGRDYVAGQYSIADMACYPWLRGMIHYGLDLGAFTDLARWVERVSQRAGVQRGMAAGEYLRGPAIEPGTPDGDTAISFMFGQTARSTAEAAARAAAGLADDVT